MASSGWCARRDSNPQNVTHCHLKATSQTRDLARRRRSMIRRTGPRLMIGLTKELSDDPVTGAGETRPLLAAPDRPPPCASVRFVRCEYGSHD